MAGPAPKTRGWHARENAHKPKGYHVIAAGLVQVNALNMEPRLTEEAERNPKNLGLKLTIETLPGEGAQIVVWKAVHFHKEVKKDEFDHVIVRWDVDQIANFPIVDDTEHAAEGAAAMTALNAKHAAKGKPAAAKPTKPAGKKPAKPAAPAPKKPAPKKPAPKKAAAKKKTAPKKKYAPKKKAAKKAKKKAAKKSVLKRLVSKVVKKLSPAKKKKRR
ncbi:MAG: hypothetical protein WDO17_13020 [Alphaproteobacteria bacterium]